ncbi:MAG: LPS export ABC transporter periplasmic protein LptC, partial [Pelagibacterales bacterium]|nr:LPS export ABC transporter periplasmic protein LptC [Pelagibacterales bacterium]
FENVVLTHLVHKATSENLDISFNNNKALMYRNIIYNKPGTQLTADRLEIDLITKNTKIFMDKKYEKIKIINYK